MAFSHSGLTFLTYYRFFGIFLDTYLAISHHTYVFGIVSCSKSLLCHQIGNIVQKIVIIGQNRSKMVSATIPQHTYIFGIILSGPPSISCQIGQIGQIKSQLVIIGKNWYQLHYPNKIYFWNCLIKPFNIMISKANWP